MALAWVAFLLYWAISAIKSKPAERLRNSALTVLMMAAFFGLFWLLRMGAVPTELNVVLWQSTLLMDLGAIAIVLIGLFIFIWARRSLGSNWNANAATKKNHKLVQTGPYKRVRHPVYSGFLTMVLGTSLSFGQLIGLIILVICIVGLYLKALREESFLTMQFSEAYPKYKMKTKALIPYIL
jgi:Putative protein-S-isoprenylcysteine methyltransferase